MLNKEKMSPAALAIYRFGGVRSLARKLKTVDVQIAHSNVSRWALPKEKGGRAGLIPSRYHQPLLSLAKQEGVKLSTEDLIYGER